MITPSEAFGLFLTALRNNGSDIPLSDRAVAELIRNGLECLSPDGEAAANTAENLALDLEALDAYFVADNGEDDADADDGDGDDD